MVTLPALRYSPTIDIGTCNGMAKMNMNLGLRALLLLAFVAASTAVIVTSELVGAAQASTAHAWSS
jgi:hypothetical protein